jgi:transcriptional regulator with XRE-family HTH domain
MAERLSGDRWVHLSVVLQREREKRSWRQADAARICKVSQVQYAKWEQGVATPSIGACVLICKGFEISLQELLGWSLETHLMQRDPYRKLLHDMSKLTDSQRQEIFSLATLLLESTQR